MRSVYLWLYGRSRQMYNILMTKLQNLVDRIKYSLTHQAIKFKNLGYYKFVSLLNFILLFTLLPSLLQIIWPYFQDEIPPIYLYLIIMTAVNFLVIFLYSIPMYFIYTGKYPFFQQFRSEPNKKWMWEENPQKWRPFFLSTLKVTALNIFIYGPLLTITSSLVRFQLVMNVQEMPSTSVFVWQFIIFLIVEQIAFYFVHKLFHTPKFYWIHKQHHQYNVTISLALVYANPLQHIFANLIPSGLGYTLLSRVYPVHIFSVIIWLTFRVLESSDGHCGYDWPWALSHWLPFSAGGNYHYFHHSRNSGNYGAILHILDTLNGTNDQYIQKQEAQTLKSNEVKSK